MIAPRSLVHSFYPLDPGQIRGTGANLQDPAQRRAEVAQIRHWWRFQAKVQIQLQVRAVERFLDLHGVMMGPRIKPAWALVRKDIVKAYAARRRLGLDPRTAMESSARAWGIELPALS